MATAARVRSAQPGCWACKCLTSMRLALPAAPGCAGRPAEICPSNLAGPGTSSAQGRAGRAATCCYGHQVGNGCPGRPWRVASCAGGSWPPAEISGCQRHTSTGCPARWAPLNDAPWCSGCCRQGAAVAVQGARGLRREQLGQIRRGGSGSRKASPRAAGHGVWWPDRCTMQRGMVSPTAARCLLRTTRAGRGPTRRQGDSMSGGKFKFVGPVTPASS